MIFEFILTYTFGLVLLIGFAHFYKETNYDKSTRIISCAFFGISALITFLISTLMLIEMLMEMLRT